MGVSALGLDVY